MRLVRRIAGGLNALLRRRRVDQELDDELRAWLEASIDEKMRAGMTRAAATRAARVELGSLEAVKDHVRDAGWETRVENVWRDARHAVRTLRRSPAFSLAAIATLALGIGANTAIFSVINAVLLRPLPVERADELIALSTVHPGGEDPVFSYPAYRALASAGAAVADAVAASTARRDAIAIDGPPEPVDLKWVSGNYFTTLGVGAPLGRTLLPADDRQPPGAAVAVLSDAFWTRRFGRDPAAIGRTFRFRAAVFTIVGVAARGFSGETPGEALDLWMPMTSQPGAAPWIWNGHSTTWLGILARRRPEVTPGLAQAGFEPAFEQVRAEMAAGATEAGYRKSVLESRLRVSPARGGASRLRDNLSAPLLILMALVALVLVVSCANVANLMIARAAVRRREAAMCLALGAGRARLIRQGLAEALLLAAAGGGAGLALAWWGSAALAAAISAALPVSLEASPDARVLAFTIAVSCLTAMVFGLWPALAAARIDPLPALKVGGGPGRGARIPLRRTLVVTQIAVSLVLLVAAGLFVRSLIGLRQIDPGFEPDRVLLLQLTPPAADGPASSGERRSLYRLLIERAAAVPGVAAASASFPGVFTRGTWGNAIAVDGYVSPSGATPRTLVNAVTTGYFDVMRIAVLRGRAFSDDDRETTAGVAIVNEAFARRYFDGANALGRRVGLCSSDPCGEPKGMMEIVGVSEDAKYAALRETARPMLYVPFTQRDQPLREIEVRSAGDPASVAAALHRELSAADARVAVVSMIELRDQVDASIVAERLIAMLSTAFGLLALALAAMGVYGIVAYVTAQRTGEIGIRMALGASRRDVRRLVLRDSLTLAAAGALLGVPAALGGARLVSGLLYQVGPADPLVLSLGLALLAIAALAAAYVPTRRAVRVDPVVALRAE